MDLASIAAAAKQAELVPRFWRNVSLSTLEIWLNNEENRALQFLLDTVIYSYIQNEVTLQHPNHYLMENHSILVYGSFMSLQGETVSFFLACHFIDDLQGQGEPDLFNSLCVSSHQIQLSNHDVWSWVQWLDDVHGALGMPKSVSLLNLWQVLKYLMIPGSYDKNVSLTNNMWWDDDEKEFNDQNYNDQNQPDNSYWSLPEFLETFQL